MRIDLHAHTDVSDGRLTPTGLVELAGEREVDVLAVTDHDTMAGVAEAQEAGRLRGVRVVGGIELSSRYEDRTVHVLGYFCDPSASGMATRLDEMRAERLGRARRMVAKLSELGYDVTMDDVLAEAGGDVIARPHVARALVAKGYVPDVRSAFSAELIGDGGRAQVPRRLPSPAEAVELIRDAGGVAVVAHPGVVYHEGTRAAVPTELVAELAEAGLGGVEVDHPDHPPEVRRKLRRLALGLGLVPTGGSDFHDPERTPLGTCTTSPEAFAELEARATVRPAG